jgi:hypothetical protein
MASAKIAVAMAVNGGLANAVGNGLPHYDT